MKGKKYFNEKGLLSLEASIALTIFLFLMLFLYSFFVVFEARNEIAHVTLSTADSIALDAFGNTQLGGADTVSKVFYNVYGQLTNGSNGYTNHTEWYKNAMETEGEVTKPSGQFIDAIETRFIAYLTNGDDNKADEILEKYHIKGGVDGLDFSGSSISGDDVIVCVRYTIEYEFNTFGMEELEMEQSCCSKLWK